MTVSMADVGIAARDTLVQHLPAYLAAFKRPLPEPESYELVPVEDSIRRVLSASLAVSVPGMTGPPTRHGNGVYDASFVLSVAVVHEDSLDAPILTAGGDYAACVADCLLDHRGLGGLAKGLVFQTWSWDLVGDQTSHRTLGLAVTEFAVTVRNVLSDSGRSRPGAGVPTVLTTHPEVTAMEDA